MLANRDCMELINLIDKKCVEEEKSFIYKIINKKEYFIGIRQNAIIIYNKGAKILTITSEGKKENLKVVYIVNQKYLNQDKKSKNIKIEFNCLKQLFEQQNNPIIINSSQIYTKQYHEKICQQWIATMNNQNNSEWVYIDMEYANPEERIGRFDLIAISKKPSKEKIHKVCLIELKVGTGSYGGECNEEKETFGSGIVGHIIDYLKFFKDKKHYSLLKNNIISIINCYKALKKPLPNDFTSINSTDNLDKKPEILIVSFSHCPKQAYSDNRLHKEKTEISYMKNQLGKYLFNKEGKKSSKYNLESIFNNDKKEIDGFLNSSYRTEKDLSKHDCIIIKQEINDKNYNFIFSFIDADSNECWKNTLNDIPKKRDSCNS